MSIDVIGKETLNVISSADRFNFWMYKSISKHASGKILEIGSGIGNISAYFLNEGYTVYQSDISEDYCQILRGKFGTHKNLGGVIKLDIASTLQEQNFMEYAGFFDTIVFINVLEHIEDENKAIQNCRTLLKNGGKVIILVPAYMKLFNMLDAGLRHCRRYTKKSLNHLLENNGFKVIGTFYFNFMGIFGWYISGKMQRNSAIPDGQMLLYDKFVGLFRLMDKIVFNKMGLSVISVVRKEE